MTQSNEVLASVFTLFFLVGFIVLLALFPIVMLLLLSSLACLTLVLFVYAIFYDAVCMWRNKE